MVRVLRLLRRISAGNGNGEADERKHGAARDGGDDPTQYACHGW